MHYEGEIVVPELLEKLGIKRPILLGHSDGGSIALIFAGKFPEAVSGLMLEAPHVFVEDLSIASITQAKTTYESTDFAQEAGTLPRECRRDVLGLERHLARSRVSLVEHRGVCAADPLSGALHPGRAGRVRHDSAGGSDQSGSATDAHRDAARLQAFAAPGSARADAGVDGGVCGGHRGE